MAENNNNVYQWRIISMCDISSFPLILHGAYASPSMKNDSVLSLSISMSSVGNGWTCETSKFDNLTGSNGEIGSYRPYSWALSSNWPMLVQNDAIVCSVDNVTLWPLLWWSTAKSNSAVSTRFSQFNSLILTWSASLCLIGSATFGFRPKPKPDRLYNVFTK